MKKLFLVAFVKKIWRLICVQIYIASAKKEVFPIFLVAVVRLIVEAKLMEAKLKKGLGAS